MTWEKQTGVRPLGWTVAPTEEAVGRSTSEMLKYALGELRRIPAYAADDKAFCVLPADFPHDKVKTLEILEPSIEAAVALEAKKKTAP